MLRGFKKRFGLSIIPIFVLIVIVSVQNLYSQNKASEWVQKGLNSSSIDYRIQAFEKAVQLDPNYVEAYFYLGLAYKSKSKYSEAEVTLSKAYFKNPYALNNEMKTRILFELGTVHAILGKPEEARDALKGAKALAQSNNNIKGKICYELGRIYIEEGKFDQALNELREGKALLPQSASLFDRAIALASNNKSIDDRYNKGISFLYAKRYQQAVKAFNDVIRLDPNFKDVQSKLREANAAVQQDKQNRNLHSLYEKASNSANNGSIQEAINLFDQVISIDPDFRDASLQLDKLRKIGDEASKHSRIGQFYNNGVLALRRKNWNQALSSFEKVRQIDGNYKNLTQLIEVANQGLQKEQKNRSEIDRLYYEGVAFIEAENWEKAFATLKELRKLNPGYKDIDAQLLRIKEALSKSPGEEAEIDAIYQDGLFALQNGDWLQAVLAFEKVKMLDPKYKDVQNRLADAQFNLNKNNSLNSSVDGQAGPHFLLWAGSAISMLILPVFGVLFFSPMTRARVYLMQGKYSKAAEIYEKLLLKRPEKVKLYPLLANIYLIENRRDEKALKVFEMILKLNIFIQKRAEINTIVANYYLTQGRTDGKAIAIMERELSTKINKLQSGT